MVHGLVFGFQSSELIVDCSGYEVFGFRIEGFGRAEKQAMGHGQGVIAGAAVAKRCQLDTADARGPTIT